MALRRLGVTTEDRREWSSISGKRQRFVANVFCAPWWRSGFGFISDLLDASDVSRMGHVLALDIQMAIRRASILKKKEQETLWEKVVEEGGREGKGKNTTIADLFAEEKYTEAILKFISTTHVGKMNEEAKVGHGPLKTTTPWIGDAGHDEWRSERRRGPEVDEMAEMDGIG